MQPKKSKCSDKMSFDTKLEAENTATVAEFQRGSKLKVYKCRGCGLWHLSSNYGEKYDD
jgi:hypothetical protein